jgi:hypothetical protein
VHHACFAHHLTNTYHSRSTLCPPSLTSRTSYDDICIRYQLTLPPSAITQRRRPSRLGGIRVDRHDLFRAASHPCRDFSRQRTGTETPALARTYKGTTTTSSSALCCRFQRIAALFHRSIDFASRDSSTQQPHSLNRRKLDLARIVQYRGERGFWPSDMLHFDFSTIDYCERIHDCAMPRAWHLPLSDAVLAGTQNRKMRATLSRRVFLERSEISASAIPTKNPRAERCLHASTQLPSVPTLVSCYDFD